MKLDSNSRHKAIRIALYNHKGGVGKTTLTVNIASALADKGYKVLLVDSDPQCNLTSYLFEESVVDSLLDESDTQKGRTLWSVLKPIVEAEGNYNYVSPYDTLVPHLMLLAGDIRLAEFEESLGLFWGECLQRRIRGFRGTNALSAFVNQCCHKFEIDYVFYDTGPNIGPLNRIILLDCDYFIVPVSCDLFSIRALKSLGHTLASWITDWRTITRLAPVDIYLMTGKPKFLGYIPQRFKIYGGAITRISQKYIAKLEKVIFSEIVSILRDIDEGLVDKRAHVAKLGEVKDFSTLIQQAQSEGVPLSKTTAGTAGQKEQAARAFDKIAKAIILKTL